MEYVEYVLYSTVIITVCVVMYTIVSKKLDKLRMSDVLIASALVILLIYSALSIAKHQPRIGKVATTEHFAETDDALNKILTIIGIQNTSSAQDVTEVAKNIATLSSDYNENLSAISNALTLYYSAFSKNSYPKSDRVWYNISSYFTAPNNTCPEIKAEETNIVFTTIPSYSREHGFAINKNVLMGPRSHELGIGSDGAPFSLFLTMKFNPFVEAEPNTTKPEVTIFKLFANTINNNGVSLSVRDLNVKVGDMYGVELKVMYGNTTIFAEDPRVTSNKRTIMINPAYTYMFILTKTSTDSITLLMYPNIDSVTSMATSKESLINGVSGKPAGGAQEEVLLSNKNMVINDRNGIISHIFNFGIYNKALDDYAQSLLFLHVQTEIQKTNQLLRDLAAQISRLKSDLDAQKACPYTAQVCESCTEIKDWTDMTNIILNGTDDCLSSVDAFCSANPKHEKCTCWNPQNALSKTTQCQNYVNIFRKTKPIMADAIDPETLSIIKAKNNLCDCSEMQRLRDMVDRLSSTSTPLPNIKIKPPKVLNNIYYKSKEDLQSYESEKVKTSMYNMNRAPQTSSKEIENRYAKEPITQPAEQKLSVLAEDVNLPTISSNMQVANYVWKDIQPQAPKLLNEIYKVDKDAIEYYNNGAKIDKTFISSKTTKKLSEAVSDAVIVHPYLKR